MTQRHKSVHQNLYYSWPWGLKTKRLASSIPAQGLCWLSSISLLSGGFVFADTGSSVDNIVPTSENSTSAQPKNLVIKTTANPESNPHPADFSQRRIRLRKKLSQEDISQSTESIKQPKAKVEADDEASVVIFSRPTRDTPRVSPKHTQESKSQSTTHRESEATSEVAETTKKPHNTVNTTTGKTKDYNNTYIDPTDYSNNTTGTYEAPNSVVITERSSGCRTVIGSGQGIPGSCAQATQHPRVANSERKAAPSWLEKSEHSTLADVPASVRGTRDTSVSSSTSSHWSSAETSIGSNTKSGYHPHRFIPNPGEFSSTSTVSSTPIAPSAGTLPPPMTEGNLPPRPSNVAYDFALASVLPQIPYSGTFAYRGGAGIFYPLSVPAPITSFFGWRVHPITGNSRFHSGTDLGAAYGTPVLAAQKGQIQNADWMGGYGLAVVINHNSAEQTLYGHLSEIFVQPGQWVEPGTVVGRVGSTGNSTKTHLHFEVRHLTQDGWVAVNPGVQLQTALSQSIPSLPPQVAQK